MKKFFPQPAPRMFEPPPPPIPPRVWSEEPICEQVQSPLLGRLPAEIRNEIYCYVFGSREDLEANFSEDRVENGSSSQTLAETHDGAERDDTATLRQSTSPSNGQENSDLAPALVPAHPLSLLNTCRMVNQEATILAFTLHTFVTRRDIPSFHELRTRTSPLTPAQLSVITSLAYDVKLPDTYYVSHGSEFIANSLLLFPSVTSIEIRIKRRGFENGSVIHNFQPNSALSEEQKPKRVPKWLLYTTEKVTKGTSFSWQTGQKWSVEWPQQDKHTGMGSYIDAVFMEAGAEDAAAAMVDVEGIEPCACGCGSPSWLSAEFVQETGRKVQIRAIYYGDVLLDRQRELQQNKLKLVPGAEPLQLTSIPNAPVMFFDHAFARSGFGWDVDEDYWEELKDRKRGYWAKWWNWKLRKSNGKVGADGELADRVGKGVWRGDGPIEDSPPAEPSSRDMGGVRLRTEREGEPYIVREPHHYANHSMTYI